MHALVGEASRKVSGPTLNTLMIHSMETDDDNQPINASSQGAKDYRRRTRRRWLRVLLSQECQHQRRRMTQTDFAQHVERLEQSNIVPCVLAVARLNVVNAAAAASTTDTNSGSLDNEEDAPSVD